MFQLLSAAIFTVSIFSEWCSFKSHLCPPIPPEMPLTLLSVAGSDPSGGAGVQGDLKTFSALGAFGMAAVTLLTAQSPTAGVASVHIPPSEFLREQLANLLADKAVHIDAMKIGALGSAANVRVVANMLGDQRLEVVVLDPVVGATAGGCPLLQDDSVETLKRELVPLCSLWTPNLPEAAKFLGREVARDEAEAIDQGKALLRNNPKTAVLLKGGHLPLDGTECNDWLFTPDGRVQVFGGLRIPSQNTHGTGCALSSAVAVMLARGLPLEEAVREAKAFVLRAIEGSGLLAERPGGNGPIHHFAQLWQRK